MTQTVLLGDICDIKIGRTPPRKESQWFSATSGSKWVSIKDMGISGKNIFVTSENLTNEAVRKFRIPTIKKGTLMLSFKLTVGRLGFATEEMYSNEAIAQLPVKNPEVVDKDWLYYYLKNFNFDSLSSTSSIATAVNSQTVKNIKVVLPDLEAQKKIANILGTIDEKIELNRQMNETLEQMGQALFRHYFIDNPEAERWGKVALGDKIKPRRGKSLQSKNMKPGVIPVVSGGLRPAGLHSESNTIAPVITVSASGANAGFTALWDRNVWSADSSFIDSTITTHVYFYYLFLSRNQKRIYEMQTGSGQPHIYPSHLELLELPNAPDELIAEFNEKITANFEKIEENKKQIQTLTTLRDTLLPRLLSGKINLE